MNHPDPWSALLNAAQVVLADNGIEPTTETTEDMDCNLGELAYCVARVDVPHQMVDAYVSIHPGMRSGNPVIGGTGAPVDAVAGMVWVEGVDAAQDAWDITREQVVLACWFVAAYGIEALGCIGGRWRLHRGQWRQRWGQWAIDNHAAAWRGDWDGVVDPPTAGDEVGSG